MDSRNPRGARNPKTPPTAAPVPPRNGAEAETDDDRRKSPMGEGPSRRDEVVDRRTGVDRRDIEGVTGTGAPSGFDRRRGVGRRLSDFTKSAEEGEFNREQFLFVQAIEAFKKANNKHYPTWTDVLEVIRLIGYRKTMKSEASLPRCEDWTEKADAPSAVKSMRRKREAGEEDGE